MTGITIAMAPHAKRKADDSNPLLVATKRLKKDKSTASNKRKLLNAEETPTGLFIVRAPPHDSSFSASQPLPSSSHASVPPRPSSSQPLPRPSPDPSSSHPPLKKFRASSQTPTSQQSSRHVRHAPSPIPEDSDLETAVRAMNDEADHLRRQSRGPTLMDKNLNPAFHFPRSEQPGGSSSSKKGKGREVHTDASLPIPQNETPQIERNKRLREGAMAAIVEEREHDTREQRVDHRRRSSVSRGKRASTSFEITGVIASPHNSVSETSFYKHIDCDLPESERIRQLLMWCAIRASGTTTFSSSSTPSKPKATAVPSAPLPHLSEKATQFLRNVQDDIVRMLAERKIDLSLYGGPESSNSPGGQGEAKLRENEQNVKNKNFEVKYSQQIRQLEEEEDQWKKSAYHYDTYCKKFAAAMEKRVASATASSQHKGKDKGKQREVQVEDGDLEDLLQDPHDIPVELRHSLDLVQSINRLSSPSSSTQRYPSSSTILTTPRGAKLTREELVSTIGTLLPDVKYKIDRLHLFLSAAGKTTRVAEGMLDGRFKLLRENLAKRGGFGVDGSGSGSGDGARRKHGVEVARNYVRREGDVTGSHKTSSPSSSFGGGGGGMMDLFRALSRIDMVRPPEKIGDEVRRAAREVKRIGESGVRERRMTAVYGSGTGTGGGSGQSGVMMTPRKTPGTPRRAGTPGRERTPGR